MKTRLLIRPNSDIKILDTVFVDGYVGLLVEDLRFIDILPGDLVSLEFNDTSLNPQYAGNQYVTSITDYPNVITLRLRWGNNGPKNPGYVRNWLRITESLGQADDSFDLDRVYNFDINQLEVDRKGRYIHGGLYDSGTYSNIIGGRVLQTGQLDTSFNVGSGFNDFPRAILMYDDGSMIIGGRFTTYNGQTFNRIVKLNEDGSVNDVFNSGTGFNNYVYGLAKHKKGVIVVGAFTSYNGTATNGIIKLKQDGTIDTSFDFGTGLQGADRAYSVLTTSDNKVVVGGHFTGYRDNASNKLVRINADGSWDSSFVVGSGPNGNVLEIKEDLDRSIIFCGNFSGYDGDSFIGICKVDQNGTADNDWSLPFNSGSSTTSIDIQSNGKYIIAGSFTSFDGNSVGRIIRLNADYSLDTTFNPGTGFNALANAKLLTNGQIICFGQFTTFDDKPYVRLMRLNAGAESIRYKTQEFDLEDDIQFPLNYSILDIRQPDKRKSDFSKTISLPGTKNNNKIFQQIFLFGSDSGYNPNLRKDVICLQDGFQIFTGFIKIDTIDKEDWNDKKFNVKLSGQLTDIYSKLVNSDGEDLKISDLDFSEYDHFVNRGTIIESWIGNITKNFFDYSNYTLGPSYSVSDSGFVSGNYTAFVLNTTPDLQIGDVVRFEMDNPGDPTVNFDQSQGMHTVIDVGTNSVTVNLDFQSGAANTGTLTKYQSMGQGYVYPTMNLGPVSQNISQLSPQDFRISWYTKDIMDKIFNYIGFRYESSFFESEYFKRLVITGNPPTEYYFNGTNNNVIPSLNSIQASTFVNRYKVGWTASSDEIFYTWNNTNRYYQNGNAETNVKFDIQFNYIFSTLSPTGADPDATARLRILWVRSLNLDGSPNSDWEDSGEPTTGSNFTNLGNILDDQGNQMLYTVFVGSQPPSDWNSTTKTGVYTGSSPYITLRPGEKIKTFLIADRQTNQVPAMFFRAGYGTIHTNYIRVNSTLPSMTAKDLLNSLVSMHNLYLEADKVNPRSLRIETFNDYYLLDENSKDWTSKIDISQKIELEPVSPNTPRNYIYKYSDDGDYLNKLYKDDYQNTYGTLEISQDSEFNSDTITTTVKFPQTVLDDRQFDSTRIIVPTIVKDVNYVKSDSFNTRILYFTGIRFTDRFQISGSGIGITSSTSDYFGVPCFGYAGHMDNPFNATLDINFGLLDKYYFGGDYSTKATRNTLFQKYYSNYFEEITDPNTKLLTAYFKLNSFDISSLSFRNLFYIKDTLWRLQKVIDYDPLSKDPTKCEFIKVKRTGPNTSFNPQSISSGNILDTFPVGRDNPLPISPTSINMGSFNETRGGDPNITVGNNNQIDTIYTYTNGNDNRTTGPGSNIIINGDGTTLRGGNTKIIVSGTSQSVGTYSTNIYSYGDDNRIGASSSNIYNFGNNNTFPDGLTNSYVFGSGITATQSNSVYIGGNVIFSGTVSFTNVNITGLRRKYHLQSGKVYYFQDFTSSYELERYSGLAIGFGYYDFYKNGVLYESQKYFNTGNELLDYATMSQVDFFESYIYLVDNEHENKVYGRNILYWKLRGANRYTRKGFAVDSFSPQNPVLIDNFCNLLREIEPTFVGLDNDTLFYSDEYLKTPSNYKNYHSLYTDTIYRNGTYSVTDKYYIYNDLSSDINSVSLTFSNNDSSSYLEGSTVELYRTEDYVNNLIKYVVKPFNHDIYSISYTPESVYQTDCYLLLNGKLNYRTIRNVPINKNGIDGLFATISSPTQSCAQDRIGSIYLKDIKSLFQNPNASIKYSTSEASLLMSAGATASYYKFSRTEIINKYGQMISR